MAIAYARVSYHSRSKGHSAVAAAAYRAGIKLYDERTGKTHDYSKRNDVVFSEVMKPAGSEEIFYKREFLWNEVERCENRKNSQVAREFVLALPKELSLVEQIELAKRFSNFHFVENGLVADINIHDKGNNPHAHILLSTRRLEKDRFSSHKARDLNPACAYSKVVLKDDWSDTWGEFQNNYFKEKNIDITVDLNHVLPEKHQGKLRDSDSHFIKENNEITKEARRELALNDMDNFINLLSFKASVFTKRDLEKLLFKSVLYHEEDFSIATQKLLSHKDVISLGLGDDGKERFTTRQHYIEECRLFESVDLLNSKKRHVIDVKSKKTAKSLNLSEEQREAVKHVIKGQDISVVIGKPGTGKTTRVMKALNEHYTHSGYRILGAALASKAAKGMESESGITSNTIASMNYRIASGKLKLTNKDVIVIDESGMVDFSSMSFLINAVKQAKAKVVLVGDPEQLKPIGKGDLFRGIAARTGYISLEEIRRQSHEGDRQASLNLSKGNVELALNHYEDKGALHFHDAQFNASSTASKHWFEDIQSEGLESSVMLAFTRKAVKELNEMAHEKMLDTALLTGNEYNFDVIRGTKQTFNKEEAKLESQLFTPSKESFDIEKIKLAFGERLLFKKKDKVLGVDNGDMATIIAINDAQFTARLDNCAEIIITKDGYKEFDYGYALTVHKSQGMSIDNAHVVVDSPYWDKFLSFVAMTRHKKSLNIYSSKEVFETKEHLINTLSKAPVKDNVLDYPIDFAIRYGFEPDSIAGRAVTRLVGIKNKIQDALRYIVNYESYLNQKEYRTQFERRTELRQVAGKVARYLDIQASVSKLHKKVSTYKSKNTEVEDLENKLYEIALKRDKIANNLINNHSDKLDAIELVKYKKENVERASKRFDDYLVLKKLHSISSNNELILTEKEKINVANIDMDKNYYHIKQFSSTLNEKPSLIYQELESKQKIIKLELYEQLKNEILEVKQYDEAYQKVQKSSSGYPKEKAQKELIVIAKKILSDKELSSKVKKILPNFIKGIEKQISIDRDRGIER